MTEEHHYSPPEATEQEQPPDWEQLFHQLKTVNSELRGFYTERDRNPFGMLTDQHRKQEQALLAQKGSLFVDILTLRRQGEIPYPTPAFIQQGPNETLHPFSQNTFYVLYPVPEEPEKAITAKTRLPQIRKPGSNASIADILELIGDYTIAPEEPNLFLERTVKEIGALKEAEILARKTNAPDELRYYLNRLRTNIAIDRLLGMRLRGTIPPGYDISIGFLSAATLSRNRYAHLTEVMIESPAGIHAFTLLPPRAYRHVPELEMKFGRTIEALGGYDYYDYRE